MVLLLSAVVQLNSTCSFIRNISTAFDRDFILRLFNQITKEIKGNLNFLTWPTGLV
jgi:hypothetical protein